MVVSRSEGKVSTGPRPINTCPRSSKVGHLKDHEVRRKTMCSVFVDVTDNSDEPTVFTFLFLFLRRLVYKED